MESFESILEVVNSNLTTNSSAAEDEFKGVLVANKEKLTKLSEDCLYLSDSIKKEETKFRGLLGTVTYHDALPSILDNIESQIKALKGDKSSKNPKKGMLDKYKDAFTALVKHCWHSEPRVLGFFSKSETKHRLQTLAYLWLSKGHTIDSVFLHLHSTRDVCDECRMQLTRACYKWLYRNMVEIFKNQGQVPLFHMVISWFEEYPGAYKNIRTGTIINTDELSKIGDLAHGFSDMTKPLVTIVKLSLPEAEAELPEGYANWDM